MAKKKYLIIKNNKITERIIDYEFYPGFAISRKQKNIQNIHKEILKKEGNYHKILEVSSKSLENIGIKLSAFNLCIKTKKSDKMSVESIFQGSKVFEKGGPYSELMYLSSKEAKTDPRIKNSGKLVSFLYNNQKWDLEPKTIFYDWIYINALWQNIKEEKIKISEFEDRTIFTDVEFNHEKSLNCQARSIALFLILYNNGLLENCLKNKEDFISTCKNIYTYTISLENNNSKKTHVQMNFNTLNIEVEKIKIEKNTKTEEKMQKLNGETLDIVNTNIERLKELFPDVFSEGKIDFEALKNNLGEFVDKENERYSFSWHGKEMARKIALTPSTGTLRPCKEESKEWDTTDNLYIEGDNLEILKLLQKSYFEKIKMIYIDPPYNTGTDILYKNNFFDNLTYYKKFTGQISDENFSLTTNSENAGRYHSNWLSFMYPKLKLARNLLTNDGLISIAIDDYEQPRLKILCDEIFGEYNFIGTIITRCNPQGRGKKNVDPVHEYHLLYCKNIEFLKELKILKKNYSKEDYSNLLRSGTNSRKFERPKRFYPILVKNNNIEMITTNEYASIYSRDNGFDENYISYLNNYYKEKGYEVVFPIAKNGEEKVWQRTFERVKNEYKTYIYQNEQIKVPAEETRTPTSLWAEDIHSNVSYGTNLLINLFNQEKTFDYPKSIYTVKDFLSLVDEGIVLDFFSGSATTAHATIQLNAELGSSRKFILIQLPEKITSDKNAFSLGYKNICEIGKERIRRAGEKIKSEFIKNNPEKEFNTDIGFKVFKLDSSNIKSWDSELAKDDIQKSLLAHINNIKEDRTENDLLFELLLKQGLDLTTPITEIKITDKDKTLYNIGAGALYICLSDNIGIDIAKSIIEENKIYKSPRVTVIFKDNGFISDVDKTNVIQTLKVAGITEIKSI